MKVVVLLLCQIIFYSCTSNKNFYSFEKCPADTIPTQNIDLNKILNSIWIREVNNPSSDPTLQDNPDTIVFYPLNKSNHSYLFHNGENSYFVQKDTLILKGFVWVGTNPNTKVMNDTSWTKLYFTLKNNKLHCEFDETKWTSGLKWSRRKCCSDYLFLNYLK